jgi:hypothetical protein
LWASRDAEFRTLTKAAGRAPVGAGSRGWRVAAGHGDVTAGVDDLDAGAALAEAVRLRRGADAAEARLVRVAAHWADLHAVLPDDRRGGDACFLVDHAGTTNLDTGC